MQPDMLDQISPGLTGEARVRVDGTNTTDRGGVVVFSTPNLVSLVEKAASHAIAPHLPPGSTTVGARVDVRHLAATPEGYEIVARARLVEVDGRRLTFEVEAFDPFEKVCEGRHERYVVDVERYRSRLGRKLGQREGASATGGR